MAKENSMIDNDFVAEGDEIEEVDREKDFSFDLDDRLVEDTDDGKEAKKSSDDDDGKLEIEIEDDTPKKDRGKWVADDEKDGEPDEISEEELKQYSKDVQKRINKVTARMHAERRSREQYERQIQEAEKLARRLYEDNKRLTDLVENGEQVLVNEHKGRIESQLEAAKRAYREARDAGDTAGEIAAQEQIAKAAAALDRVSVYNPAKMPRLDEKEFNNAFQPQVRPDEKASSWHEKNPWFGRDDMMTHYARGLHQTLVQKEGVDPRSDVYWSRIDHEMRKRFPEKFEYETSSRQPQRQRKDTIVGSAARSSDGSGKKVTLTKSQVALARRLGITPEQYAQQLIKDQQNRATRTVL